MSYKPGQRESRTQADNRIKRQLDESHARLKTDEEYFEEAAGQLLDLVAKQPWTDDLRDRAMSEARAAIATIRADLPPNLVVSRSWIGQQINQRGLMPVMQLLTQRAKGG